MFRWIAIMIAASLTASAAFAQSSSPQTPPPAMPMGSGQMMGGPMMNDSMMNGGAMGPGMMDPGMMRMMQMMHAGMMGPDAMDGTMGGSMMCHAQSRMMMGGMAMMGAPSSHLEGRLAFVKAELAIDGAHEAAWQKYADAVRNRAQPLFQGMMGMHGAGSDRQAFPAAFDAHIKMMEDRLAGLKSMRDASVALYESLNPEQKQKADSLLPMSFCM